MGNLKYQYAFQYAGVLLYSLFVGFLVSFLIGLVSGVLLYPFISVEDLNFHIPEFIISAEFFLGGILAPWLISLWFGTVEKRVALTSYCFTTLLAIVNVVLIMRSGEVEGFGNSWSLLFFLVSSISIIPVLILSHLFLYFSYKARTQIPTRMLSAKLHTNNQHDQHILHRFAFRCTSIVLFSLFLGSLCGIIFMQFLNAIPWILRSDDFYKFFSSSAYFLFPVAFFFGGILAPRLVSFWFGSVDKKITLTSYCFTAFFTVIFIISAQDEELMMLPLILVHSGITPLCILSCLFLYLSFKKRTVSGE